MSSETSSTPTSPPPEPEVRKKPEFYITIYRSWCKACGICVATCPKEVYTNDQLKRPLVVHAEACTGCELCVLQCPDFAIRVDRIPHKPEA